MALAQGALAQDEPRAAKGEAAPWRVVLIRNFDAMYPVNVIREQALRQALMDRAPRPVEIYTEEVDPLRFPAGPEPEHAALLKQKYKTLAIDLVIASGLEPLEFATRYREEIWPGTAIVFNGVIEGMLDGWKRPPKTAGVSMNLDVEGTLKLALALIPEASKVYFITGTAPFDQRYLFLAQKALQRLPRHLDSETIVGLTYDETAKRVATLKPETFVMYLTMLRDGAGNFAGPGAPIVQNMPVALSLIDAPQKVGGSCGRPVTLIMPP